MHEGICGLPKTSADVAHSRHQLFYLGLVMFLRSLHGYISAIEPAGSTFILSFSVVFYR